LRVGFYWKGGYALKIVCWEIEQEFLLFGRHSMGIELDGEGLEPLKQVLQLFNRVCPVAATCRVIERVLT